MPSPWSNPEITAAVNSYFQMLHHELSNQKYNKTEHRHTLIAKLNNRSNGSVELKHQNISAVLIEMGLPYIDGYKPRFNYQHALVPAVADYLTNHPELHTLFQKDAEITPHAPTVEDFLAAMEEPPAAEEQNTPGVAQPPPIYNPIGINYLEREARNQSLGEAGESFILNFERARLIHAGKDNLADRIEHVATTIGPAAGFDIRSYETNGSDRFIEAKTTKYGKSTPFFVTPNELRFSKENAANYYLYRLFKFREKPRMFALHGHLMERCVLEPSEYRAQVA